MMQRGDDLPLLATAIECADLCGNTSLIQPEIAPQQLLRAVFDDVIRQRMAQDSDTSDAVIGQHFEHRTAKAAVIDMILHGQEEPVFWA